MYYNTGYYPGWGSGQDVVIGDSTLQFVIVTAFGSIHWTVPVQIRMIKRYLKSVNWIEKLPERAVSPVIGVILMVAITVILAAVIGTFVIGLGDQVQETAPNSQFTFDWDTDGGELTITHDGGQSIDTEEDDLYIVGPDGDEHEWNGNTVSAGDSETVTSGLGDYDEGTTIRVVWRGGEGTSATLASDEAPDNINLD